MSKQKKRATTVESEALPKAILFLMGRSANRLESLLAQVRFPRNRAHSSCTFLHLLISLDCRFLKYVYSCHLWARMPVALRSLMRIIAIL